MEFLASLDRYLTLLKRVGGSEPSIGQPTGESVNMPRVFFVDSVHGSATNGGLQPALALTTIQAAHDLCTAGRNDMVVCLPGHAENIATASALTLSKSGVTVIGVGSGALRPTLTWTTTGSTCLVSGANVTLKNILCTSTVAEQVKLFSVTGTDVTFDGVDYIEDGSTSCLQFLLTTSAAKRLTVKNCSWQRGTTAAVAVSVWIQLVGADFCKIIDNYLILKGTAGNADAFITGTGTLSAGVEIARNYAYITPSVAAVALTMLASSTGIIHDNRFGSLKTASAGTVANANCFCYENYVQNELAKSGFLDPAPDS